jgi:hypothetical protein
MYLMNHRGHLQVKALGKVSMGLIGKNGSKVHKVHFCKPNKNITMTAREFRGKRGKPGFRASQSDNQILNLPTASVCPQTACNPVGKSGQFLLLKRLFDY